MRFGLEYLVTRLYIKRERFWYVYMSPDVQSKKTDGTIVDFPIFTIEDIDRSYIRAYLKKWISMKYKYNLDIEINKEGCDYFCKLKPGALIDNIVELIISDYKEVFIDSLIDKNCFYSVDEALTAFVKDFDCSQQQNTEDNLKDKVMEFYISFFEKDG
ncbi:hypothetical protein bcCo53_001433 (plasmid) [Borrelia coriaceae]|uniref:Uncharacterized protein n=1 Tax=Borrelia coriaceae ATCC 43381 TaxID=1408429 RepID=W5T2Q0_9SPIR|nr:hypothetical protein [Borrelia coriaceae]AHH11601.1 Hypothetical protein BCO_0122900 [Borrelia coriaceae ATCC 43381]UPA17255.1 hypothetical protein bcCo53_001433 [Borrelia coriaceae]